MTRGVTIFEESLFTAAPEFPSMVFCIELNFLESIFAKDKIGGGD